MNKVLAFFICTALFVSILILTPAAVLADETEPTPGALSTSSPYALLSGIDVTAGTWDKEFSSDIRSYVLTLDELEESVTITPEKEDASQTLYICGILTGSITITLENGKYKYITITVKQQGKTSRVYNIKVVREQSSNNDLASLSVSAGTMDSEFNPSLRVYNVALDQYTPFITVTAAKAESHATLRIDGYIRTSVKYSIAPGKVKIVIITVRSQTGVTKDYYVRITREEYPITEPSAALIDFAKHYIGTQYVHGGKTPAGFDCSGFVYYCLNGIGVNTGYRTSGAWAVSGYKTILTMEEMLPGDILCFNGHVGIYMGDNKMIDSAFSVNGVSIKSCVSPYWVENFICGKRVLKQKSGGSKSFD